jgi:hypothetical protein
MSVGQRLPQRPQWSLFVRGSAQTAPVPAVGRQQVRKPGAHDPKHAPQRHIGVVAGQRALQAPQFIGSALGSRQRPSQRD